MKVSRLLNIALLLSFILSDANNSLYAKQLKLPEQSTYLDKSKWQEIAGKSDYSENFKEFKPKEKKNKSARTKNRDIKSSKQILLFLKIILIVVIIGVFAFVFFLLLKHFFNFFEEKVPRRKLGEMVENLEDDMHNADFDFLLNQAVEQGEYTLAIRILYLRIIKQLSDKNYIVWKREKTNGQYVREMFNQNTGKQFALITTIYEQAWFGNNNIDQQLYKKVSGGFNEYLKQLV
ncbi:MAG: DUF4129 domain-containing protein [Bacteroidales bacterium]|nr:DUF4129 domain-containing protein [Bacteroidales bacterium]